MRTVIKMKPSKVFNQFITVKNSKMHGKGVFASRNIKKNSRIIEYIGEKITKREGNLRSEKRLKRYLNSKKNWLCLYF
tara:strand:+ start:260 stop:493 length:234 start_codon:yes stop_codon:yes gene_type:complete